MPSPTFDRLVSIVLVVITLALAFLVGRPVLRDLAHLTAPIAAVDR